MQLTGRPQIRYSAVFVAFVLGVFLYVMARSLSGGWSGFEANFYERKTLVAAYNRIRLQMGDRVFPQVVVGKGGWLLFNSDGNLDSYQNSNLLTNRLETIHRQIILLDRYFKARGITLIVVVAPNKETIYPNKVPSEIKKVGDESRLDLLLKMFTESDPPIVIDLRQPLQEARAGAQVYYKTDTHWNAYGAYVAYREILSRASQVHPDLQPLGLDQFNLAETAPQTLDLARLLGGDFAQEPRITILPKFSAQVFVRQISPFFNASALIDAERQKRKLLIYHDSFGIALNEFLKFNFAKAIYIHNNGNEDGFVVTDCINILEPDVVVIEIVERDIIYLDNLLYKLSVDLSVPYIQP